MPAIRRATFRIDVEGAELLASRLAPDHLMGRPLDTLLDEAATIGQKQAEKRAPKLSGQLAGGIRKELHAAATPAFALVIAPPVTARDGFRYGFALDASPRYTYRGRRAKTKGWLSKIPAIIRRLLTQHLRKAEQAIAAQFNGGGR